LDVLLLVDEPPPLLTEGHDLIPDLAHALLEAVAPQNVVPDLTAVQRPVFRPGGLFLPVLIEDDGGDLDAAVVRVVLPRLVPLVVVVERVDAGATHDHSSAVDTGHGLLKEPRRDLVPAVLRELVLQREGVVQDQQIDTGSVNLGADAQRLDGRVALTRLALANGDLLGVPAEPAPRRLEPVEVLDQVPLGVLVQVRLGQVPLDAVQEVLSLDLGLRDDGDTDVGVEAHRIEGVAQADVRALARLREASDEDAVDVGVLQCLDDGSLVRVDIPAQVGLGELLVGHAGEVRPVGGPLAGTSLVYPLCPLFVSGSLLVVPRPGDPERLADVRNREALLEQLDDGALGPLLPNCGALLSLPGQRGEVDRARPRDYGIMLLSQLARTLSSRPS